MARIRTFKPEFLRHEKLQELESAYCGSYPMFVFMGLWAVCDKNGVFEWKPKQLKLDIYPFLEFDMENTLNILKNNGFIEKFDIDNCTYGYVINFEKHQKITGIEKNNPSKYPNPPKKVSVHDRSGISNDQVCTDHGSIDREKEREMEMERKAANADGSSEPPPFFSENAQESKDSPVLSMTEPIELANLLLDTHRKEFPDYLSGKDTKKIMERWAEDIEKLIRIDKKMPEMIRQVILWVKTEGNFWFSNIESGKKLREKFERLFEQMQTQTKRDDGLGKAEQVNCYIPTAEQTARMLEDQKRSEGEAIDVNLGNELKKIAISKTAKGVRQ
jgi:hypothetical protein